MKKILAISIGLSIASSSFAYSGHGFKIIDTKIESTPGFNVKVEEVSPDAMPPKTQKK